MQKSKCHGSSVTLKGDIATCDVCGRECELMDEEKKEVAEGTESTEAESNATTGADADKTEGADKLEGVSASAEGESATTEAEAEKEAGE